MKNLLERANDKYFLKLGKYTFSPLIEVSAYSVLNYCDYVKNEDNCSTPFILCFPEKRQAALWLSISILTNYFYEDYIDNEIDGVVFKRGDKVKIYGTIAEVQGWNEKCIYLKFKDQGDIPISQKNRSHLSIAKKSRRLNNFSKYKIELKKAKAERNPISKILEPNDNVIVNKNNFQSTVLLVTGRGTTNITRSYLNAIEIYGSKLNKVFEEGTNLIIKPNFDSYKTIFNEKSKTDIENFIIWLERFNTFYNEWDFHAELQKFLEELKDSMFISAEFDCYFINFCEKYSEDEVLKPRLDKLAKLYPGVKESLPQNLRAVVLNDISQLEDYEKTVQVFLKLKIPVIVIGDRNVETNTQLYYYENLINKHPDYFRLNWNKVKLAEFIEMNDSNKEYIDIKLWNQAIRFSKQKILFEVSEPHALDSKIPIIQKRIQDLEGFELLKKHFYHTFYPALYAVKNSKIVSANIHELVCQFEDYFHDVKELIMDDYLVEIIKESICVIKQNDENNKEIDLKENTFTNIVSKKQHEVLLIPTENERINLPDYNTSRMVFTGYPYQEYSGKFLANCVTKYFIPELVIKCWPNEAIHTYNYLRRRIMASNFTDLLPENLNIPCSTLLKSNEDIEKEISSILYADIDKKIDNQYEITSEGIHAFKYTEYTNGTSGGGIYKVKTNILNFEDGSFMFLPKSSKILAERETENGKMRIVNTSFQDLTIGDRIFKYKKDRIVYRELAHRNPVVKEAFDTVELWRKIICELFTKNGGDFVKLEKELTDIAKVNSLNANPSRVNLYRWLYDDELIAPYSDNLKMILYAGSGINVELQFKKIIDAYKIINAYTISLSSKIKKLIAHNKEVQTDQGQNFKINIEGSEIEVEGRVIITLEASESEVDYHNTRKILC